MKNATVLTFLCLMLAVFITTGCGLVEWMRPTTQEPIVTDQAGMIIFDADEDGNMLREYDWLFEEGTDFWTPTRDDVLALNTRARDFLRIGPAADFHPDLWERYEDYWRQYVGFFRDGQRLIYANYMCGPQEGWLDMLVEVMDGGDCYFQLTYDVDSGEFVSWYVNGEA